MIVVNERKGSEVSMEHTTKKLKLLKLGLMIIAFLFLLLLTIKLFPFFTKLGTQEGQLAFKSEISDSGFEGFFLLLGLQLLQILVPFLPGEPIEFLAGMCYGTLGGLLLIFLGSFLSSCIIFFSVRKLGNSFIQIFFGEEQINKLSHNKWFSSPEKIEFFFLIAFLLPGTPKDLFVYLAGLLPIKPSHFLLISTLCRFPSVISSTFAGANLVDGNWRVTLLTYAITFVISGLGIFVYNRFKNRPSPSLKMEE